MATLVWTRTRASRVPASGGEAALDALVGVANLVVHAIQALLQASSVNTQGFNRSEGQETLIEFPDQNFNSFDEFLRRIGELCKGLAETVTTFSFSA